MNVKDKLAAEQIDECAPFKEFLWRSLQRYQAKAATRHRTEGVPRDVTVFLLKKELTELMEELRRHRPIYPAPGWRVFQVAYGVGPGGIAVIEKPVLGWQVQNDGRFKLVIMSAGNTSVATGRGFITCRPGTYPSSNVLEELAKRNALDEILSMPVEVKTLIYEKFGTTFDKPSLLAHPREKLREMLAFGRAETTRTQGYTPIRFRLTE